MKRFLKNLFKNDRKPNRRACLNLETMEQRVVPTTTLVGQYDYTDAHGDQVHVNAFKDGDKGYIFDWTVTLKDDPSVVIDGSFKVPGNPNPDDPRDPSASPADKQMLLALLKQHGGPATVPIDVARTPFGQILIAQGKSIVPVWNPGDMMQENEFAGGSGGGFYAADGGSYSQQLVQFLSHGGSGHSGKGDDSGKPPDSVKSLGHWGEFMPGPPPLVNPVPIVHAQAK